MRDAREERKDRERERILGLRVFTAPLHAFCLELAL